MQLQWISRSHAPTGFRLLLSIHNQIRPVDEVHLENASQRFENAHLVTLKQRIENVFCFVFAARLPLYKNSFEFVFLPGLYW